MRRSVGLGLVLAAVVTAPAGAQSGTGGAAPLSPQEVAAKERIVRAPAPTANLYGSPAPRIKRFAAASARPGTLVRITGRGLKKVDEVLFLGSDADAADDTSVPPRRATRKTLVARVPRTAVTGRLAVALADGTRSPATATPLTVEPVPASPPAGVIDAEAQCHKVFFGAQRPAELSYVVGGTEPAEVQVELIRASDGLPVATWTPGVVAPSVPQTVEWDGTSAGKVQPDGTYQFRVTAVDSSGTRAMSAQTIDEHSPGAFDFYAYRFPIAGAHTYGKGAAAFGGGRGHQGHDVFAACGTPLVAARGGVVKVKQYHSAAGYYLVIDGDRTGTDFVYMHLREAALVNKGDKVKTGQLIGFVGATGRASGCHLHFEEWTSPGWYSGGAPINPLADLQRWDADS